MDPVKQAQIDLINEMLDKTKARSCYYELRVFLINKKFELEHEDN